MYFLFSSTLNANGLSDCSPTNFPLLIAMRPSLSPIELYAATAIPAVPLTAVSHWRSVIKKPPHVLDSLLSCYYYSLWWFSSSRNFLFRLWPQPSLTVTTDSQNNRVFCSRKLLSGICLSSRMSEIQSKYRIVWLYVVVSFCWSSGRWIWRRRRFVCQWGLTRPQTWVELLIQFQSGLLLSNLSCPSAHKHNILNTIYIFFL